MSIKFHITNRLLEAGQRVLLSAPREKDQRSEWARQRTMTVLHLTFLDLSASAVLKDWNQEEEEGRG